MTITISKLVPVQKIYQSAGFDLRFVGGCVRDSLLNIPPHDYDLATPMPVEQGIQLLKQHGYTVIPTGISHGTLTLVIDKTPYEITTLRRDVTTDGRRATIAHTQDWEDDALRRDFTINALYMDFDGKIYDYTGGQQDLAAGIVRFIGAPEDRIHEDYLRILRFFRFHERFSTTPISEELKIVFTRLASKLKTLSSERITQEFFLILSGKSPLPELKIMADCHILSQFLRSFDLVGLDQLLTLERSQNTLLNPMRRFASLNCHEHNLRLSNKEQKYLKSIKTIQHNLESESIYYLAYIYGLDQVLDALLLNKDIKTWHIFKSLTIPTFPLNGHDLQQRGISGSAIGNAIAKAEKLWANSEYKLNKKQLLDLIK